MNKSKVKNGIISFFNFIGIDIAFSKLEKQQTVGTININIGAGDWSCKGWINLDHSSGWYSGYQRKTKYIEYDIRKDRLPFEDASVDSIYCSHVVEHIENEYVDLLFNECFRVLKKGGILRVACPDAEFLWNVTKVGKSYWGWRRKWCKDNNLDYNNLRPVDLLIREIATPKMKGYGYAYSFDYEEDFNKMKMEDFLYKMTSGLEFNEKRVGDHINFWTYNKMENVMREAGFNQIWRSKYLGSISASMRRRSYFDSTYPCMSLYVEAEK